MYKGAQSVTPFLNPSTAIHIKIHVNKWKLNAYNNKCNKTIIYILTKHENGRQTKCW